MKIGVLAGGAALAAATGGLYGTLLGLVSSPLFSFHSPPRSPLARDFARAPFKDEVRPLILKENTAHLLELT